MEQWHTGSGRMQLLGSTVTKMYKGKQPEKRMSKLKNCGAIVRYWETEEERSMCKVLWYHDILLSVTFVCSMLSLFYVHCPVHGSLYYFENSIFLMTMVILYIYLWRGAEHNLLIH